MKYIIFGDDGKEYGPADAETLRKWAEAGRVLPNTQVRNVMMKKWNKALDLDFLKDAFEKQGEKVEEQKTAFEHGMDFLKSIFQPQKQVKEKGTAFKYAYVHDPASLLLRAGAALFDGILLLFYAIVLTLLFSLEIKAGVDANMAFLLTFVFLFTGILLYYGIALGVYAQTFGMWFWGIMIVSSDIGEVFLGRAYFHVVMMILLGIAAPFVVYLNPKKRSLHEYISGTRIIRIAARPKS
jgi:uncharacterized RDD family membrane protein YckC